MQLNGLQCVTCRVKHSHSQWYQKRIIRCLSFERYHFSKLLTRILFQLRYLESRGLYVAYCNVCIAYQYAECRGFNSQPGQVVFSLLAWYGLNVTRSRIYHNSYVHPEKQLQILPGSASYGKPTRDYISPIPTNLKLHNTFI